jgi:hypothetical protein
MRCTRNIRKRRPLIWAAKPSTRAISLKIHRRCPTLAQTTQSRNSHAHSKPARWRSGPQARLRQIAFLALRTLQRGTSSMDLQRYGTRRRFSGPNQRASLSDISRASHSNFQLAGARSQRTRFSSSTFFRSYFRKLATFRSSNNFRCVQC